MGCGFCGTGSGFCSADHAISCGPITPSFWPGAGFTGGICAPANAAKKKTTATSRAVRGIRNLVIGTSQRRIAVSTSEASQFDSLHLLLTCGKGLSLGLILQYVLRCLR